MRSVARYIRVSTKLLAFGIGGALLLILRYLFKTPQPLTAVWPGESRIYKWTYGHVFYKVKGAENAPPIVLLHAPEVGGSSYEMRHLIDRLAEHYRVYAPDLLGFGLSDRPNIDYSASMYTTLCRDFLADVVGRSAILLASGLSCQYAVAIAADHAELCDGLIVMTPRALFEHRQPPRWLASLTRQATPEMLFYALITPQPVLRRVITWQRHLSDSSLSDEEQAYMYANAHQFGAQHAAMAFLAGRLVVDNVEQCFAAVKQPSLMIWGQSALAAHLHLPSSLSQASVTQHDVARVQEDCPEKVVADILNWQAVQTAGTQIEPVITSSVSAVEDQTAAPQQVVEPEPEVPSAAKPEVLEAEEPIAASQPVTEPEPVVTAKTEDQTVAPQPAVEPEPVATTEVPIVASQPVAEPVVAETEEAAAVTAETGSMYEAYCVKCKVKRPIQNARKTVTKNGRNAIEGNCPVCGTRLFRFGTK